MHVREIPSSTGSDETVPLVLVHGFTGSGSAWGEDLLARLSRDRPLIVIDLPGHGKSARISRVRASHPPRFAEIVRSLAAIPTHLGHPITDWLGYSMGGRMALAVAFEHPEVVRRLVLESASPGLASARERRDRRADDEALADRLLTEGIEPFVSFWMALPMFRSQARLPDSVLRAAREARLANDPEALAAVLRGLGTGVQPSYWKDLAALPHRVLVLTGGLDAKFRAIARSMEERLSSPQMCVVPDAGHTMHLEAPRAWLEAVEGFLERPESEIR